MTIAISIFAVTYVLIASERVDKTIAAMLGASAVILFRQIGYVEALQKIDLNVIFLLVGMMIIVHILATTGVFEWAAIWVTQRARGDGFRLLVLLLLVTALLSALLDNVTTVILIAPVTILITQILEIPTVPFLILEAVFSNLGGTSTLVGDPPNVLIGSQTHLGFVDFLRHLAPVAVAIILLSLVPLFLILRRSLAVSPEAKERVAAAHPERAIVRPGRLAAAAGVFAVVLVGFLLGHPLGVEPGLVAITGAFLMAMVCGLKPREVLAGVEWGTIFFFIGLFMLVGCLEHVGLFTSLSRAAVSATRGNLLLTCISILWISALLSAIVDNIPLVIAMIPLIRGVIPLFAVQLGLEEGSEAVRLTVTEPLYWSLALGVCLGGNGTLIGASANVVIAQLAKRNKYRLSFWDFARYGFPLMILSLLVSTAYVWLRYF